MKDARATRTWGSTNQRFFLFLCRTIVRLPLSSVHWFIFWCEPFHCEISIGGQTVLIIIIISVFRLSSSSSILCRKLVLVLLLSVVLVVGITSTSETSEEGMYYKELQIAPLFTLLNARSE